MNTIDVAEPKALREAAEHRGGQIAMRMRQVETLRRDLWARMDHLRKTLGGAGVPAPTVSVGAGLAPPP